MERSVPLKIRAGVTTTFSCTYDADQLVFIANYQGNVITADGVADGDSHTFTLPYDVEYYTGIYTYLIYAIVGDARIQVEAGKFEMLPSLESGDARSAYQIMYDAVLAALAGRATSVQRSVTVGDKSISYMSFSELWAAKEHLEAMLAEEEQGKYSKYVARFKRT